MSRYLRIENGIVVEEFETNQDIKELFHPDLIWIECEDTRFDVGSCYKNGSFFNEVKEDESSIIERFWRDSELLRSDVELYKAQDADPKSVGSVADWRAYRKSLRAWPESEYFPNVKYRPTAPDAKE